MGNEGLGCGEWAACSRTIDMGGRGFRSPALWDCISRRLVFRGGRFVAFPAWRNSRRLVFRRGRFDSFPAWCERRDSNPHGFTRWNLNPVRLPVPPLSQGRTRF